MKKNGHFNFCVVAVAVGINLQFKFDEQKPIINVE